MADTGFVKFSSFASDDSNGGTRFWEDPENAELSDDVDAEGGGTTQLGKSEFLRCLDPQLNLPFNARIVGIEVTIEGCNHSGSSAQIFRDDEVRLFVDGSAVGENKAKPGGWKSGEPDEVRTYGGATDTWGLALTEADITNFNFGVGFAITWDIEDNIGTLRIDQLQIRVYYEDVAGMFLAM